MPLSLLLAVVVSAGIGSTPLACQVAPLPTAGMSRADAERLLGEKPSSITTLGAYGYHDQCHYRWAGVCVVYTQGKVKSVKVTGGRPATPGNGNP